MTPWRGHRKCAGCGKRKPWPDGFGRTHTGQPSYKCKVCAVPAPRYRQCPYCGRKRKIGEEIRPKGRRCFACQRERRRRYARAYYEQHRQWKIDQAAKYRRAHPERQAYYQHKSWLKLRSDRERHAEYLQDKRIWDHLDAERKGRPIQGARTHAIGAYDQAVANHVAPMLPTGPLREWLMREFANWDTVELARWLGEDDSHLGRILRGEQEKVSLHIADRICVRADCTHMLSLLYPEPM